MIGLLRWVQRVLAFVGKELVEIVRRPGALVSLVIGPFLIMVLFGIGYGGAHRPLDAIIVVTPGSGAPGDPATYQALAGGGLHIVAVVPDRATADAALAAHEVDIEVIAPSDPQAAFLAGQASVIEVRMDSADPTRISQVGILATALSDAINREILRQAAAKAEARITTGVADATSIPPDVIAAPTRTQVIDLAPSTPGVVGFYGPAVLALVLQHVAASVIALSLIRERSTGMLERFRVSPIGAAEIVVGKLLAVGLLAGLVAAATTVLLVSALGVPLLGDPATLAAVIALLVLASMGLGLLIAMFSDSDRQAVQLALLLLLASVFFGGLVIATDEFTPVIQGLLALLPVTHGTKLINELMLRGTIRDPSSVIALALIAATSIGVAWVRLRGALRRA